jgi:hypothetical protein
VEKSWTAYAKIIQECEYLVALLLSPAEHCRILAIHLSLETHMLHLAKSHTPNFHTMGLFGERNGPMARKQDSMSFRGQQQPMWKSSPLALVFIGIDAEDEF